MQEENIAVLVNSDERVSRLSKLYNKRDMHHENYELLTDMQMDFLLHPEVAKSKGSGEVDVLEIKMAEGVPFLNIKAFFWYTFHKNLFEGRKYINSQLELHKKLTGVEPIQLEDNSFHHEKFRTFLYTLKDHSLIQVRYGINKIRV